MSLALPEALFFTGIDWAAATHAVCVMDAAGKITPSHHRAQRGRDRPADPAPGRVRGPGQDPDCDRAAGRAAGGPAAGGRPPGGAGQPERDQDLAEGEVLSGAKSDAGDAAVIAEYLRLRRHRLQVAVPYSGETQALRTVVRTRGDLVACASRRPASSRRCWRRTGRARGPSSPTSSRRSAWRS